MHEICDRNNRNQCCGSGILISDPDFYPSRIPDPTTAKKEKGGGGNLFYLFWQQQMSQNLNFFISEQVKKKI
jgi:hypothetical protein